MGQGSNNGPWSFKCYMLRRPSGSLSAMIGIRSMQVDVPECLLALSQHC